MPKLLPHRKTEIAKRNRLFIRDENGFSGCCWGGREEVFDGQDVRDSDVRGVGYVPEIGAGADYEVGFAFGDHGVDGGD